MKSAENRLNTLALMVQDLAQNIMLIGFEVSSSRIEHRENSIVFTGFSGKAVYSTRVGQLELFEGGEKIYDSLDHAVTGNVERVIAQTQRMGDEMLQVYRQQVLGESG